MKKIYFLGLLCMIFIISGCAAVHVTKTAKGYFEPTDPDEVEILVTKPDRSFVEIATVTTSNWPPGQTARMHNSLRAKSAPLGADAVILLSSGVNRAPGGPVYWATGVAICYKTDKK